MNENKDTDIKDITSDAVSEDNKNDAVCEEISTDAIAEEKKFDIRGARVTFGLISLGLFATVVVIFAASFSVGAFIPKEILESDWFIYVLNFVVMYLIAFPIGYLFVRGLPKDKNEIPTENKMNTKTFVRLFISALCLMYIGNIVGSVLTGFFTFFKYFLREMPSQSFSEMFDSDALLVKIIFVAVIAPIFEEIVFRKVVIDRTKRFGYMPAIIFSGVAFGFFHGNFSQFFYATLLRFLLGYIYCRTGKIIHTMLMHSVINIYGGVVPMLIFAFVDTERLDSIQMIDDYNKYMEALLDFAVDSILPIILYALHAIAFLTFAVIGLVYLIKDRKRYAAGIVNADPPMPKEKAFSIIFVSVGFILFVCGSLVEFYLSL